MLGNLAAADERRAQYEICRVRGHQKSGLKDGEWDICKFCQTYYKWTTKLVEQPRE